MPTYQRITALNLFGGDTITYSAYPDFYEFRVLKKVNGTTWEYESFGPLLDRTVDDIYVCTGIHYIDMKSTKSMRTEENFSPIYGHFMLVVSVRGKE